MAKSFPKNNDIHQISDTGSIETPSSNNNNIVHLRIPVSCSNYRNLKTEKLLNKIGRKKTYRGRRTINTMDFSLETKLTGSE